jgi:hypothetical protein
MKRLIHKPVAPKQRKMKMLTKHPPKSARLKHLAGRDQSWRQLHTVQGWSAEKIAKTFGEPVKKVRAVLDQT